MKNLDWGRRLGAPFRAARRHPGRVGVAVLVAVVAVFAVSKAGDDGQAGEVSSSQPAAGELLSQIGDAIPDPPPPPTPPEPSAAEVRDPAVPSFEIARMVAGARVGVYNKPGGKKLKTLGAKTEFGSARTFYIAERRGGWLGVPTAARANNKLGWIRDDPNAFGTTKTSISIRADLSRRIVQVKYGRRVLKQIPVTIGRAGSETPPGTFSVTDGLAGRGVGKFYGCCVLALSGHQGNLPPGWIGGDRIAIHGTPGPVGGAASAGCLRASNRNMVDLFALVPLGAPVFIEP